MHLLVVTNETAEGDALHEAIRHLASGPQDEVMVVSPALNSRLRHWLSDEDAARAEAAARLERCTERLRAAGIVVFGHVGDADPLQAIADALAIAPADELLIATHPRERSNWLERDLVSRACARFDLPVAHVVVDVRHPSAVVAA